MIVDKCELCSRARFELEEWSRIEFDGNTFTLCENCRNYLSADWGEGNLVKILEIYD